MPNRKKVPAKIDPSKAISVQRKRFVEEYLMLGRICAARAAVNAGVPAKAARTVAHNWLKLPEVQAEIEAWEAERELYVKARVSDVLEELVILAKSSISDIVEKSTDGTFRLKDDVPEYAWRAVKKITKKRAAKEGDERSGDAEAVEFSVEMHDKARALDLLAKALGLTNNKKIEVSGKMSLLDVILLAGE